MQNAKAPNFVRIVEILYFSIVSVTCSVLMLMYESSFQVQALSQTILIGSVKLLGTTTYYLLYIYGTPV